MKRLVYPGQPDNHEHSMVDLRHLEVGPAEGSRSLAEEGSWLLLGKFHIRVVVAVVVLILVFLHHHGGDGGGICGGGGSGSSLSHRHSFFLG